MLRAQAGAAIALFVIVVVVLVGSSRYPLMWSNRCDPGNGRFSFLKSDSVVRFHAVDERFTIESIRPDNGFICSSPSITESHVGDPSLLYTEVRANLIDNGWVEAPGYKNPNGTHPFSKDVGGGVVLGAYLRKFFLWVDVYLWIPTLHPLESGW